MKFIFSKPENIVTSVSFNESRQDRFVEDAQGNTTLSIGIEKKENVSDRKLPSIIRRAIRTVRDHKLVTIGFSTSNLSFDTLRGVSDEELGRVFAENALMANYEFTTYKTGQAEYRGIEKIFIEGVSQEFKNGVAVGEVVGREVNACRELANTPGGDMTPTALSNAALAMSEGTGIKTTILEKKDIEELGMGLILGVDRASAEPPKFIIMEYFGGTQGEAPIVLVGKGITFDTGGINLKPSEGGLINLMN